MKQLVWISMAIALAACTRADDVDRSGRQVRAAVATRATPHLAGPLEQRVLALASCGLEGHQIDTSCPAMEDLQLDLARRGATELSPALGRRLLAHRAPAVRIGAAKLMGTDPASQRVIVDAGRAEGSPAVRQAFVRLLGRTELTPGPVAAFVIESSRDVHTGVRSAALEALTSPSGRSLPDSAPALIAMVHNDADLGLQQAACAAAGKLGVDALLPMYEQLTANADDPRYAACMDGLVAMFHDHTEFATSNERAFRLFLDLLGRRPRSEQTPPWRVMSAFCYSPDAADVAKLDAWRARSPWFDAAAVKRVMADVIADPAASWMARSAAVESLVGLGASRGELVSLRGKAGRATPEDARVIDKLERAFPE